MKKHLIPLLAAILLAAGPARAITVFDPSNYSQNVMTAARTLEQINNQIQQLQNEAQMLVNQAKNLASLDFDAVNRLRSTIATTTRLIDEARGLAYDVSRLDVDFSRLYPDEMDAGLSGEQMVADARERWDQSLESLKTTVRVQAQSVSNLHDDEGVLADIVAKSQSAAGALQATQATNQLLALQAKQAIQQQQLQIAQDRAMAIDKARAVADEAQAREVRRRFSGDAKGKYTPAPVSFYP
ncbi:P-type conjugative transfer protein TrbJ [Alcaligenes faecalis]|uniref:P-type conjugative transfer protein TrbJ n=1 Tax=Alcaligenes faecalis TaxID=511 RepID=UPI00122C8C5D|nr:P-type conjugative transfer protein TrbJ [Alcaligenes faecalis]KAA1288951.1 P-type conjugative transfer protein TrbJ [Alcaligenes faecalis]MCR4142897.1 P-type conjugative transfer protein TrbJ [Alcaligenes faecalis]WHQ43797.1 P-type conjugative transfer protein TrbJ [Alcaligenes faecalis]